MMTHGIKAQDMAPPGQGNHAQAPRADCQEASCAVGNCHVPGVGPVVALILKSPIDESPRLWRAWIAQARTCTRVELGMLLDNSLFMPVP
jgi:hypothetical protein